MLYAVNNSIVCRSASGLSAFDEALGKMPAAGATTQPLFGGFDDNFDFMGAKSASGTNPEPLSQPTGATASAVAPAPASPAIGSKETAFVSKDSVDSVVKPPQANGASSITGLPVAAFPQSSAPTHDNNPFASVNSESKTGAGDHGITFGEAFGGNEGASAALSLGNNIQSKQVDREAVHSPKLLTSSPGSQPGASGRSIASTSSPPAIPPSHHPGRSASPKPRFSTGSSSDGYAIGKVQPPPKHSKLSVSYSLLQRSQRFCFLTKCSRFDCHLEGRRRKQRSINRPYLRDSCLQFLNPLGPLLQQLRTM